MGRDYDSRDRKKSWREIDQAKDKSAHRQEDRREQAKDTARRNSGAYATYKNDLEKVFSGGDLPDYLKELMPKGATDEGRLKLIGAIQRATEPADLDKAMKAYLKKFDDFPPDFDLLLRVLEYEDEAVQLKAAQLVDKMTAIYPAEHKQQFILKLDGIAMLADDDDLRELAEELVGRLR